MLEDLATQLGLTGLTAGELLAAQILTAGATGALFVGSLILCFRAIGASGSARRLRNAAETDFRAAQDLAVEVRHLAAQMEKSARRLEAPARQAPAQDRTGDPDIEILTEADMAPKERAPDEPSPEEVASQPARAGDPALEAAKKAASEPSALLSGFLRRR